MLLSVKQRRQRRCDRLLIESSKDVYDVFLTYKMHVRTAHYKNIHYILVH